MATAQEAEERRKREQEVRTLESHRAAQIKKFEEMKRPDRSEFTFGQMAHEAYQMARYFRGEVQRLQRHPEAKDFMVQEMLDREANCITLQQWLTQWHNQEKEADAANKAALKANESQVIQ